MKNIAEGLRQTPVNCRHARFPKAYGCSLLGVRVRRAPWAGVRASMVARKRGDACGAKGRRNVDE
jgi:hypothetical protein